MAEEGLDKETQEVLKEGEKANFLINNNDWRWAKTKLLQKLSNLDSVRTLAKITENKEDIAVEIKARNMTIKMILEWLDEIEGIAKQHEANKKLLGDVQKEDYSIKEFVEEED